MFNSKIKLVVLAILLFLLPAIIFLKCVRQNLPLWVENLHCEYRENPLGIDTPRPRLGWIVKSNLRGQDQSAYQVLVASNEANLTGAKADLWNSGKVESSQVLGIVYRGKKLNSGQRCYWKVRAWGRQGEVSEWSKTFWWEMGLLKKDDWQAKWITDGKAPPVRAEDFYRNHPAPQFRKEFEIKRKVRQARLYVTGLGYYDAHLNGKKVGDSVLDPAWTNYFRRVLYSVYDVTAQLKKGENCLGVILGNGWFNPLPLRMFGKYNFRKTLPVGKPRFIACLKLEYRDGSTEKIVSDESWKVAGGPILKNNIYLGEVYDARKELHGWDRPGFDDSGWGRPQIASGLIGELQAQLLPPIKITKTLKVQKITEPNPGVFIFDFGQNFAGWVQMRLKAPAGTTIRLRYGELLYPDGTLNPMTSVAGQIKGKRKTPGGEEYLTGGPGSPEIVWQSDTYIASGNGTEKYTPRFTFHGFRYVEITGFPGKPSRDMLTGLRLSAAVEKAGNFSCSNPLFNHIQKMCEWTFLSNLFSVQSDCPHRERLGYGGDIVASSEALMFNFNMTNFYAKVVQDWQDAAFPDGMLTDTAPFVGIQYCGVGWAMAHPLLQFQLNQYYGNRQIIEKQYVVSKKWLDLVVGKTPDFNMKEGLSDHESLNPTPPGPLVTPLFFRSAELVSRLAEVLGKREDTAEYRTLAGKIKEAYVRKYFTGASGDSLPQTQTAFSFALRNNLVPDSLRKNILEKLKSDVLEKNNGHLTTGIMATKFMLDILSGENMAEVANTIVNQKTWPGWGFMLENGATTLWEHWKFSDNTYSHNHPMFGSISQWFFNWLGGIQPHPRAVGFNRIIIRPQVVGNLQWVRSSYKSVRGKIVSNWRRMKGKTIFKITIPVTAEAEVYLPADNPRLVTESGILSDLPDFTFVRKEKGSLVYKIGSGEYEFQVENRKKN